MKSRSIVRRSLFVLGLGFLMVAFDVAQPASTTLAVEKAGSPSHQVIACYFHRTVRCPTCRKISAYIDESVQASFAPQLKDGSVKMVMIDFQDPRNQKYTEAYNIAGPTLVIMDVHDGKVTSWKPAPKVWSFVGNKDQFFQYVQGEVQGYLEVKRTASR